MFRTVVFVILLGVSAAWPEARPAFLPAGSPPAEAIVVADLQDAALDTKLAAITLAGRLNAGPVSQVYLLLDHWDAFWLKHLEEQKTISSSPVLSAEAYFARFADAFDKVILYDPGLPASINVATMMASLESAIVAAPSDAERLGAGKAIEDLAGRWKTETEAYRWAFMELWPRMNQRVLACYHPTATRHHIRDYLLRHRVFHFWVNSAEAAGRSSHREELAFVKELLAAAPVNIPVLGFWYSGLDKGLDEYSGVGLAGRYGKITVVCDWATNLSLLSGISVDMPSIVQQYRQRLRPPETSLDADKVYIAYHVLESGDSPSYLQTRQHEVWADPRRGQIPINWAMGAGILDLAPPIAAYYYENATPNDFLYMAISGIGYCHPYRDLMADTPDPEAAWAEYLEWTDGYRRRMGFDTVGLYTDAWKPFNRDRQDAVTKRFIEGMPGVAALVLGMGRDEGCNALNGNYYLENSPTLVSHVLTRWPTDYASKSREENIQWLVDDIQSQIPAERPAFLNVMALSWAYNPSDIEEVHRRLGPGPVAVSLPEMVQRYRQFTETKTGDKE
jgi:hypothetical protein